MLGLSEEFPGRPSNLTRERIEALTVKPSEITTGPGRALNKARDMVATIQESIDAANAVLLGPHLYAEGQGAGQDGASGAGSTLRRLQGTGAIACRRE